MHLNLRMKDTIGLPKTIKAIICMTIEFLKAERKDFNGTWQKSVYELLLSKTSPSKEDEDWHKSELFKSFKTKYKNYPMGRVFGQDEINSYIPGKFQIVLVNGEYQSTLSKLPEGLVVLKDTEEAPVNAGDLNFFALMNLSYGDKLTINIPAKSKSFLTILNLYTEDVNDSKLFPAFIINAGSFSQTVIYESHQFIGERPIHHLVNSLTHLNVQSEANLELVQNFNLSLESIFIANNYFYLKKNSQMKLNQFLLNSKITRNEVYAHLTEEGSHISLNGLSAVSGKSQSDTFSNTIHHKSHTEGAQLFKNLISGEGMSIFNGQIKILPHAQKTSSSQLNKNLILSAKAHVFTRPKLKVAADDVKCSHGATIGQISEEEYFYLQSRGIDRTRAKVLLSHAFAGEIIEQIGEASLQPLIQENLNSYFSEEGL